MASGRKYPTKPPADAPKWPTLGLSELTRPTAWQPWIEVFPVPGSPLVDCFGFTVPQHFEAKFDTNSGPLVLLLIGLTTSGEPVCHGIYTVPRVGTDEIPPPIAETLREVPVADWTRRALLRLVTDWTSPWKGDDPDVGMKQIAALQTYLAAGAAIPRRKRRITDEDLRQVAEVYRAAIAEGADPTKRVAEKLVLSRSTAGRWVMTARKRGFLGETTSRRAGELAPESRNTSEGTA